MSYNTDEDRLTKPMSYNTDEDRHTRILKLQNQLQIIASIMDKINPFKKHVKEELKKLHEAEPNKHCYKILIVEDDDSTPYYIGRIPEGHEKNGRPFFCEYQ